MMVSIVFYLFIFYNVIVYVNCITQLYKKKIFCDDKKKTHTRYLFLLFLNESKAKILFLTLSDTYFVLIISIFLILLFDREYLVIKHFLVSVSLLNYQKTMFLIFKFEWDWILIWLSHPKKVTKQIKQTRPVIYS